MDKVGAADEVIDNDEDVVEDDELDEDETQAKLLKSLSALMQAAAAVADAVRQRSREGGVLGRRRAGGRHPGDTGSVSGDTETSPATRRADACRGGRSS